MQKPARSRVFWINVVTLAILLPLVVLVINWFIYPFSSAKPNFADVERVFARLNIPEDWEVIAESENKGIAGRRCPIEPGTACFHKGIRATTTAESPDVKEVLKDMGCVSPKESVRTQKDGPTTVELECISGYGIRISSTVYEMSDKREISIYAFSD